MNRKKLICLLVCIAVLAICLLYIAGIISQVVIGQQKWIAAGCDWDRIPGLPSLQFGRAIKAAFTPQGLISFAAILALCLMFAAPKLTHIRKEKGMKDKSRNLTISEYGTHGTASFMSDVEATHYFSIAPQSCTKQDILGMTKSGSVITLPENTPLNSNLAVCGSSGSGKSRSVSRNLILQAALRGESIIVTDPKSELYESTSEYLRANGYIVKVLNLIHMDHSDSWNCLSEVGTSELMAQTFVDIVLPLPKVGDNFWGKAEQNLLKALILYVLHEMPPARRNIDEVYNLLISEDERSLKKKMIEIRREHVNAFTGEILPPSPAYAPFSLFLQAPEQARGSIINGLGSKLQVLQARDVRDVLCHDDINLELPGKQKCAYFCIVSDQDNTFDFVSSLFFSFLFIRLVRYADNYCTNGVLPVKVKFILDEFPNCCYIPNFQKKMSTIRSRGISAAIFFQNVGQMKNRYPNDEYSEIIGACDSFIFLGCTDMLTAEFISEKTGIATIAVENTSFDLPEGILAVSPSGQRQTNSVIRRPLMTPDEVLRFPLNHELIFIRGQKVYRAERFDYSRHSEFRKLRPCKAINYVPNWKQPDQSDIAGNVIDLDALLSSSKDSAAFLTSSSENPNADQHAASLEEETLLSSLGFEVIDIEETI